jgi:hypothetical protein
MPIYWHTDGFLTPSSPALKAGSNGYDSPSNFLKSTWLGERADILEFDSSWTFSTDELFECMRLK